MRQFVIGAGHLYNIYYLASKIPIALLVHEAMEEVGDITVVPVVPV
jgi:hypothetical protein